MKNKKNKRNIGHNKLLSSFTYMLFFSDEDRLSAAAVISV